MTEFGLFDAVLGRGGARQATSDRSWLQALLDFEAALARAQARAGLLLAEDAAAITRACRAEGFDIAQLGRQAAETGNPVPALVRALGAAVGGRAAGHVHFGATSQDAIDTRRCWWRGGRSIRLLDDLGAAADAAAGLAAAHRATLMAGRTLLQQALPIPFGLLAAGWLAGLDDAVARLAAVRRERLAVQLGGAAGTLASLGDAGPRVVAYLAEELASARPLPWHTVRTRVAELAGALGEAAGALGKPARDVVLLAQTEVGEVREGSAGAGGSSTLPHKRNPIAAVSALASTARAPGLVATLLAAMVQEQARAAGNWHAEWRPFSDLLVAVGSAAAWLRDSLEHLEVDGARMRANLALTGGLLLAERVTTALVPALGRQAAHDLVAMCAASAAIGTPFGDVLAARAEITAHLSREQIAALLEPEGYLGSADLFIERALEQHRDRGGRP